MDIVSDYLYVSLYGHPIIEWERYLACCVNNARYTRYYYLVPTHISVESMWYSSSGNKDPKTNLSIVRWPVRLDTVTRDPSTDPIDIIMPDGILAAKYDIDDIDFSVRYVFWPIMTDQIEESDTGHIVIYYDVISRNLAYILTCETEDYTNRRIYHAILVVYRDNTAVHSRLRHDPLRQSNDSRSNSSWLSINTI